MDGAKISTEYGVLDCDRDHGPYDKHHASHPGGTFPCPVQDLHTHGTKEGDAKDSPNHLIQLPAYEIEWGGAEGADYIRFLEAKLKEA